MKRDILKTDKITPVGIVLFLLSVCAMAIMSMTSSWAHGVEARQTAIEGRESTLAQNYGVISAQLQDLREAQKAMDAKLDRLLLEKRQQP